MSVRGTVEGARHEPTPLGTGIIYGADSESIPPLRLSLAEQQFVGG